MASTTGLLNFVFGKIGSQVSSTAPLVRDLTLELSMPADEKAHSGSMLAGGIVGRKLQAFPASTSRKQRDLFLDYRRNIVT